ncbi:hypothetical protein [Actinomadura oligospora]|uniref:hypothetical protein n=1 Tax=Actinomadura oligospora TaxID=111804 RepID=UPI0004B8B513|nr:hypothetical protein [Actinomadura oligospora]
MTPTDTTRAGLSDRRLAARLDLARWQLRLAREHGMFPEPDLPDDLWSAEALAHCADRVDAVRAAFGAEPPIGAERAAVRLAARVRMDVERADVEVLVAQDALEVIGTYRDHPLYLLRDLDALAPETVIKVVRARKGPLVESVEPRGAARILAWPRSTFDRVAAERALPVDRLGRYILTDIQALADDADLLQLVEQDRRHAAHLKAKRIEEHYEEGLRDWLDACTAYLHHKTAEPPPAPTLRRILQSLVTARAETAAHET